MNYYASLQQITSQSKIAKDVLLVIIIYCGLKELTKENLRYFFFYL